MDFRYKIFLLLSMVLLGSIMLYVWVYAQIDHRRLLEELEQRSGLIEQIFKADQNATEQHMVQIATLVANDVKVQQLFLLGKKAVELEGGGSGGDLANQVRKSLYEYLQQSQKVLAKDFGFRQLHFHLGPGSLSFLRVHRPEKYGDRMDDVRHTIVATNAKQKRVTGFETGRVVSGIRGVVPVYAVDGGTKEKMHVGALEAGTSFSNMLATFVVNRPWLNATVLLSQEHLQANVWPDMLDELLIEKPFIDGFYSEGTTSSQIDTFMQSSRFGEVLNVPGHHLFQDGDNQYSISSFPLRDFRGKSDSNQPDAGMIVIWRDVSTTFANYHRDVRNLIFYGILLFITIELLLFYGLKSLTRGLQNELEQSQQAETAHENARILAEERSRLKTEFLDNMSHELRTPMNAIVGLGQLLGDSPLDRRQQNFIDKLNLSSKRLLTLIDEILLISDLDAQVNENLPVENFNPQQLLNRVKENLATKAKDQDVTLINNFSERLPIEVSGHPVQLERILGQLLGNAIKFSSSGDVILSLTLLEHDDDKVTLEFSVTDSGIGISAEQQKLIFQPFRQVDASNTRKYGGTGLGLTIAQRLCQQLGGDIAVESTLGKGSRFSFQLTFQLAAGDRAFENLSTNDSPMISIATEQVSELALGSATEISQLLHQLDEPLTKLEPRPCQKIVSVLETKQWPEDLCEDIENLTRLINQYRFVEAQDVVKRLKELLRT